MSAEQSAGAYNFAEIEARWQAYWADHKTFRSLGPGDPGFDPNRPKYYVLDMFPYPSGAGLHVGHPEGYTATDIVARYKRMKGFSVLHPMGWDSFGLPAEQYAIEHGVHPAVTTQQNIDNIRRQIKALGFSYDWDRELATSDPRYYRWTQWIFLQMYNAWYDPAQDRARPISELMHELQNGRRMVDFNGEFVLNPTPELEGYGALPVGLRHFSTLSPEEQRDLIDDQRLAYEAEVPVNWCPALGTVLANEEVTNDGRSDRGNHPVFRRPLRQWMLRITRYAERLIRELEGVDWPEPIKLMQRNWIGRSEGANVDFALADEAAAAARRAELSEEIRVFTTRPDTLFGATYMVLAPEHPLVDVITTPQQRAKVEAYCQEAARKSDLARTDLAKVKTGVSTGAFAINPVYPEDDPRARIPIWVADYVLMTYGTGAIMAVPAHDERDYEFAKAFDLPILDVVHPWPLVATRYFCRHAGKLHDIEHHWREYLAQFWALKMAHSQEDDAAVLTRLSAEWPAKLSVMPDDVVQNWRAMAPQEGVDVKGMTAAQAAWLTAVNQWFPMSVVGSVESLRELTGDARFFAIAGAACPCDGFAVNSGPFDGLPTSEFKQKITAWLEEQESGDFAVNYKLRDWVFSRQKYWGEPFPVLHDESGGVASLTDGDLPVELPPMEDFKPASVPEGSDALPEPPLGRAKEWVRVEQDGRIFRRDLNTMPQWAGSCWYFLRYVDPTNDSQMVDPAKEQYWMPVDLYIGGAEHAVLHLLYSRFWHKVLFDLGHVSTPEPFTKLFNQGMIRSFAYRDSRGVYVGYDQIDFREDGAYQKQTGEKLIEAVEKMSKSLKNVINPDDQVAQYGADTFRLYEMYMGPLDAAKPWNTRDVPGVHRFLQRAWRLVVDPESGDLAAAVQDVEPDQDVLRILHQTIRKVGEDIERLRFNTAIAQMIVFVNEMTSRSLRPRKALEQFILLLSPLAPHVAEEMWQRLRGKAWKDSIAWEPWPAFDAELARESEVEVAVQIGKKVRARFTVPADLSDAAIQEKALNDAGVQQAIAGKPVRHIRVAGSPKGKLVSIVI